MPNEYAIRQLKVAREAAQRYTASEGERERNLRALNRRTNFQVDEPDRVFRRIFLLPSSDKYAMERVINASDLLPVNYFEIGLRAAAAVARVVVGRTLGYGTGFMVSPSLFLTNNHVLWDREIAAISRLDFQYEDDANFLPRPIRSFRFDPDRFFVTSQPLDFTLIAVQPANLDGTLVTDFGFVPLIEGSGKALIGEYVSIIQHPNGEPKQVVIRENQIVDLPNDDVMHYVTDTDPGSSGSPVFNDQWQAVALHHSGVPQTDADGNLICIDGSVWTEDKGEDQIAYVANEGIRISRICAFLRAKSDWTPDEKTLIDALFARSPGQEAGFSTMIGTAVQPIPPSAVTVVPPPSGPLQIAVETLPLEHYTGAAGYDPDFLGAEYRIELPQIAREWQKDIAPLKQNGGNVLHYTHFSVMMRKSRRLAFFTAVNIDGNAAVDLPRSEDKWLIDPRMDKRYQAGEDLYARNDLDRGHLVRRLDPVWGERARQANDDTFHFSNAAPQHKHLNQRTWLGLEDYILENADVHDLKVSVFTGPVFRDDDMIYRQKYQIPAEFWKVVVMVKNDGSRSATAYLQTQKHLIVNLEFAYGAYQTYQVPVRRIETLTRLNFGTLRTFDPIANLEGSIGFLIQEPGDVRV
ncbi:MAG: DNA/RNA non-specific endonuclease [bacterium]|nr:DNA/RNA non-specific endonuclease [bacterium]